MALNLEQKKVVVAEVSSIAKKAHSAVVAQYTGVTVESLTQLRRKARAGGVYIRVAKNTLVSRAVEGTDFECMKEQLIGPLLYAFSLEDPGAAGRVIKDFSKTNDKLKTKLVAIGGRVYPATELDRLASLPTKNQAISILMGLMKAPIEKFVRTLVEPHAKLTRCVAAVRDQKQAAAA